MISDSLFSSISCNFNFSFWKLLSRYHKILRKIYSKLPKISLKSFNSWKDLIKFYTHLCKDLKDLSPMPTRIVPLLNFVLFSFHDEILENLSSL